MGMVYRTCGNDRKADNKNEKRVAILRSGNAEEEEEGDEAAIRKKKGRVDLQEERILQNDSGDCQKRRIIVEEKMLAGMWHSKEDGLRGEKGKVQDGWRVSRRVRAV